MSAELPLPSPSTPPPPTPSPAYLRNSPAIPPPSPLPQPNTQYIGILHTGQSLSDGVRGDITKPLPALPFALKLHDSTDSYDLSSDSKTLALVQLSEPIRPIITGALEWPENIEGVTPAEGFARQVEALTSRHGDETNKKIVTIHSVVGRAGEGMAGIKKCGSINSYSASLYEARAIKRLLGQDSQFAYDVVLLTHGETDSWKSDHSSAQQYKSELIRMQQDYSGDLMQITKQSHEPILLLTQQQTCPPVGGKLIPGMQTQWRVQDESHDKVVCVGPKYQYGYSSDLLHMPAGGYRRLGEKYAEVWHHVMQQRKSWTPLRPRCLTRENDNVIRVDMGVAFPPLRFDEHLPVPHQSGEFAAWKNGRGFEVRDPAGSVVGIKKVDIEDSSVLIHLSSPAPAPDAKLTVAYAMTADSDGFSGGLGTGRIGHLCDSDPFLSASPLDLELSLAQGGCEFTGGDEMLALYDTMTPGDYVLASFDATKPDRGSLSRPWEGQSGKHRLTFRHNQANYCVSFIGTVGERPWENPFKGIEELTRCI